MKTGSRRLRHCVVPLIFLTAGVAVADVSPSPRAAPSSAVVPAALPASAQPQVSRSDPSPKVPPASSPGGVSPVATPPAAQASPVAYVPPAASTAAISRAVDVYTLGHDDPKDKERNVAGIGDVIVVKVEGLKTLVNR